MPFTAASVEVGPLVQMLKALADETRLRIVALLRQGELCVCHLETALELTQSNASRQLGILRAAGIVADRREGNWIHYRLVPQRDRARKRILAAALAGFAHPAVLRRDVDRLRRSCGPGACR